MSPPPLWPIICLLVDGMRDRRMGRKEEEGWKEQKAKMGDEGCVCTAKEEEEFTNLYHYNWKWTLHLLFNTSFFPFPSFLIETKINLSTITNICRIPSVHFPGKTMMLLLLCCFAMTGLELTCGDDLTCVAPSPPLPLFFFFFFQFKFSRGAGPREQYVGKGVC